MLLRIKWHPFRLLRLKYPLHYSRNHKLLQFYSSLTTLREQIVPSIETEGPPVVVITDLDNFFFLNLR